jgi:hypothetical protein
MTIIYVGVWGNLKYFIKTRQDKTQRERQRDEKDEKDGKATKKKTDQTKS